MDDCVACGQPQRLQNVVTQTLDWLESKYGKIRTTRGKVHTYFRMKLNYSNAGEVKLSMVDYLKEAIESFPEQISRSVASPVANHLFKVNEKCDKLNDSRGWIFHNLVTKLLWTCKRARPDIQTAVSFLTTCIQEPDEDNWKKL